ncbi:MAG TPA: hypothetical protein VKW04_16280 [Planctomycetota bacterium]|nr:hypothetical protein [Planctomycetota bacterium]
MRTVLSSVLLVAVLGCHDGAAPSADESFAVNGKPIHPACVFELLRRIPDRQPSIAAVDVEGCAQSRLHARGRVSRNVDGWRYEHPDLIEGGFFCYWWLGATPGGTHAVLTAYNGGGSGVFYTVVFLTLQERTYFQESGLNRRWMLSSLGEVQLGDRTPDRAVLEGSDLVVCPPAGEPRRIPVPVS